jgi:hypothetical protein
LLYVAEREGGVGGRAVHKMDHLVCFLPGVLALGHGEGLGRRWGGGNRVREWQAIRALQRLGMSKDATHLDVVGLEPVESSCDTHRARKRLPGFNP